MTKRVDLFGANWRYSVVMRISLCDQTIEALAEVISGGSAGGADPPVGLYREGYRLEAWFKQLGVPFDLPGNSRMNATVLAINAALFIDDSQLVKRLIEKAVDPRDFVKEPEKGEAVIAHLNRYLAFDGYRLAKSGNRVMLIAVSDFAPSVQSLAAAATVFDLDTVALDLSRATALVDADPELAVTSANALVESVCRSILAELGLALPEKKDVQGLYKAVRAPLGLAHDKEGIAAEILKDVQSALSGLITVIQSIGSLRTHVGGAHGRERGARRIDARIARLALHSASAVALFLIETWQLRFPGRVLPRVVT